MIDHIIAAGMAASAAAAEVAPKDLGVTSFSLLTYAWVFAISILGGLVSFWQKVKAGTARRFNFAELLGEIATSAFAGVLTFWLCKAAGIGELVTAAFVGICGHMGSRVVFKAEQIVERWFDSRAAVLGGGSTPLPSAPKEPTQ